MTTRQIGVATLVAWIATIILANYTVQHYGIVTVIPGTTLVAPAAVYWVGLALVLRDLAQWTLGRLVIVPAILAGAFLSWWVAPVFAVASGVAFLCSELADFAVFTPLQRRGWSVALACSTVVAAAVDSLIFLHLAFGNQAFFWGQLLGKLTMTMLALAVTALLRDTIRRPREA